MKVSKKTRQRRKSVKALDADARQRVFERDGSRCVFCGSSSNTQWMHIFSRRDLSIRWDEDNSVVGCASCHLRWHHEPADFVPRFIKLYPDRYERLLEKRRSWGKVTAKLLRDKAAEVAGG